MNIYVNHDTVVIKSNLTEEDLKNAKMFDNTSTMLCKEDGTVIFAIDFAKTNPGVIATDAIIFNKTTPEKKMFLSFIDKKINANPEKRKDYIKNTYGTILLKLKAVEEQITEKLLVSMTALDELDEAIILDEE